MRDVYRLTTKESNLNFFIPMFVFQSRWRYRCLQIKAKDVTLGLNYETNIASCDIFTSTM